MNGLDLLSLLCGSLARRTNCGGQHRVYPPVSSCATVEPLPSTALFSVVSKSRSVSQTVFRMTFSLAFSIFVLACGSFQTSLPIGMVFYLAFNVAIRTILSIFPSYQKMRGFHANPTPLVFHGLTVAHGVADDTIRSVC